MKDSLKGLKEWSEAIQKMVKGTDEINNTIDDIYKVDEALAKIKPPSKEFDDEFPEEIRNMIREAYGDGFDEQFERAYDEWTRLGYEPEDAVRLAWSSFLYSCVVEKEECESAENEWKVSMKAKVIGSEFAKKLCETYQNFADWMNVSMGCMEFVKAYRDGINNSLVELDNVFTGLSKQ